MTINSGGDLDIPFIEQLPSSLDVYSSGIEPALQEVAMNYGQPCSVSHLARRVNLHPVYFSRRFKAVIGESPARYVTRIRMRHAALRLKQTDEPVKNIAPACGYPAPYHFSRAFKRYFGVSPQIYRRAQENMT